MKKYLTFAFCSIVFGFSAKAFAGEPLIVNALAKPLMVSSLCDCAPCTCDPATCVCPGCANGCKKAGAASMDAVYEVGTMDQPTLATIPRFPVQYQQQCVNGVCSLVPVQVAYAPPQAAPVAASNVCPCCGMVMTPEQMATMKAKAPVQYAAPVMYSSGACADGSCATGATDDGSGGGRRGPIRRILGRIFRGRRGAGGCGG